MWHTNRVPLPMATCLASVLSAGTSRPPGSTLARRHASLAGRSGGPGHPAERNYGSDEDDGWRSDASGGGIRLKLVMRGRVGAHILHPRYDSGVLTASARAAFLAGFQPRGRPRWAPADGGAAGAPAVNVRSGCDALSIADCSTGRRALGTTSRCRCSPPTCGGGRKWQSCRRGDNSGGVSSALPTSPCYGCQPPGSDAAARADPQTAISDDECIADWGPPGPRADSRGALPARERLVSQRSEADGHTDKERGWPPPIGPDRGSSRGSGSPLGEGRGSSAGAPHERGQGQGPAAEGSGVIGGALATLNVISVARSRRHVALSPVPG